VIVGNEEDLQKGLGIPGPEVEKKSTLDPSAFFAMIDDVAKKYPQVKMTFVGTAPPKEIADAAQKDPQVKATGFVDDIRPYIDEAAIMVVPIRIGSGTRLKILDAMAMGKAIVSTSVGCEGLNVNDGKDILIADEPEDFANKAIDLLKNSNKRIALEKNAIGLAKIYDWDLITQRQELAYHQVIKAGEVNLL
jgi:glycosyltransferase involved in cell wall biosynthesis